MMLNMFVAAANPSPDTMIVHFARQRMDAAWQLLDDRLKDNKWLAGDVFSIADIMAVYSVTTQRYFGPQDDLGEYENLLRWLKDCTDRPAYQKAMEKGDPEMKILNGATASKINMMEVNGTQSDHWKK